MDIFSHCHRMPSFQHFPSPIAYFFSSFSLLCVERSAREGNKSKICEKDGDTRRQSGTGVFVTISCARQQNFHIKKKKTGKNLNADVDNGENGTNDLDLMLNAFAFFSSLSELDCFFLLLTIHILINRSKHEQK